MKQKFTLFIVLIALFVMPLRAEKQTVTFYVDLHCQGCCDKIMKNIAFEKGVKDIVCDLNTKTVKVVYDDKKTDVQTLQQAFAKIGKTALTEAPNKKQCSHDCSHQQQDCQQH